MARQEKRAPKRSARVFGRHLAMIGATLLVSSAANLHAQSDPTLIGAGQRPYVIMVVDSSASMDFSLEGEQKYPCHQKLDAFGNPIGDCDTASGIPGNNPPANPVSGDPSIFEWRSGSELGDSDNDPLDETLSWGNKDYENPDVGPAFVGPCMVWKDACSDYSRPPWFPDMLEESSSTNNDQFEYDSRMWERLRSMRGLAAGVTLVQNGSLPPMRLQDNNQPRHVQIKEILTGDMILKPEQPAVGPPVVLNPERHGPGCWFVPRMSGTQQVRTQWHACSEIEFTGNRARQKTCTNNGDCSSGTDCVEVAVGSRICIERGGGGHQNAFHFMIDREEPRPHIQEVYDEQLQTGIMDNLANTAIFAVAMFDGSQGRIEGSVSDATAEVREPNRVTNHQPVINDGIPAGMTGSYAPEDPYSYDLGVYKIVGPTQLDVPSSQLSSLSSFTQYAVQDAGYLRNYDNNGEADKWRIDPKDNKKSRLNYNFSTGLEKYVQPYQMGHQPLSGATPLAAAMRDIHMYMLNGQVEFDRDGRAETPNQPGFYDPNSDKNAYKELDKDSKSFIVNPVQQDPYKRCRAKHVVLMTDGFPEPERASGSIDVGSSRLSELYGFPDATNRYKYETAENEIEDLVTDVNLNDVEGGNQLFLPRVHVVGLNLLGTQSCVNDSDCAGLGSDMSCAQINNRKICAIDKNNNGVPDHPEKLGRMAAAGKTCAQWQLVQGDGKKYVPSDWPAIGGMSGTCNSATDNCLVRQLPDGDAASFLDNDGTTSVNCIAPALILEQNDRYQAEVAGVRPFRDDLTEALQLVFNQVLGDSGGVASRTRATVINTLDDTNTRGQYRTFSGVDVQGSSVFWKGILERQTLACDAAGGNIASSSLTKSLSDEIDGQVRPNLINPSGFEDNRRIFTSMSRTLADGSIEKTSSTVALHGHKLENYLVDTSDEFQRTRFTGGSRFDALVRIPMEVTTLLQKRGIALLAALDVDFLNILNAVDRDAAFETIDVLRGRTTRKIGRVLGAILNSNPISVGPPNQDLSIGSYRAFREKYGRRTSMLYVATLDGLLHAIHTGEGQDATTNGVIYSGNNGAPVNPVGSEGATPQPVYLSDTNNQREAWAYAPEMLRNQYALSRDRQPNLMDGSPVVADVRLCDKEPSANQSAQACGSALVGTTVPAVDQWRTVLVQGLGNSGAGYFALDVTHTGGPDFSGVARLPDPIPLWEFDWDWEQRQILALKSENLPERYSFRPGVINTEPTIPGGTECDEAKAVSFSGRSVNELDEMPFMGLSVGDAAIGTVVLEGLDSSDSSRRIQRPVAIFSGGLNGDLPGPSGFGGTPNDCLAEERRGRAIYVVDLQTGSLLRRFVDYSDPTSFEVYRFQAEVAGTPVVYDNRTGVVSNRAFVGDVAGRLFRLDLNSPDPTDWEVELMFDPCQDTELKASAGISCDPLSSNEDLASSPRDFGPASFEPAVALDNNRRVTVVYGLGERTDTSVTNQIQAMVAIREREAAGTPHEVVWFTTFQDDSSTLREKLTGPPIIFNYGVYFTTFVEQKDNVCQPGKTRIWGLQLVGDQVSGSKATLGALDFTTDGGSYLATDIQFSDDPTTGLVRWYEPQDPMLIRGVTVAFPPDCSESTMNPSGLYNGAETSMAMPELLATTNKTTTDLGSTYSPNSNSDLSTGTAGANLKFQSKRLSPPKASISPLSWFVIGL